MARQIRTKTLRSFFMALLVAFGAIGAGTPDPAALQARKDTAPGTAAFNRHDYKTAITLWEPVVTKLRGDKKYRLAGQVGLNIGIAHFLLGDLPRARAAFTDARADSRRANDPSGDAGALLKIGMVERNLGNLDAALHSDLLARAIHAALKDPQAEAQDLVDISRVEELMARHEAALASLREASQIHHSRRDYSGEADDLVAIANVLDDRARYYDALATYQRALTLYRKAPSVRGEAAATGNIGIVEFELGRYAQALRHHRRALAIDRQRHDAIQESIQLNAIGNVQEALGEYTNAMATYGAAVAIAGPAKAKPLEGAIFSGMGNIAFRMGQYDLATRFHRRALAIHTKIPLPAGVAGDLGNLGDVDYSVGRYDEALRQLRQAIAINHDTADRDSEGNNFSTIGDVQSDLARYSESLESHRHALRLHRRAGNPRGEGQDLGEIGTVQDALGRHSEALRSLLQALDIQRKIRDARGEASSLNAIGRVESHLRRYDAALRHARGAVAIYRRLGDPEALGQGLNTVATIESQLNHRDAALSAFDESLGEIETVRAGLLLSERPVFFAKRLYAYDAYIAYLERLDRELPGHGYDRRAFETLERKESRATLEEIAGSSARRFRGLPLAVLAEDRDTQIAVERTRAALEDRFAPAEKLANVQAALQAARDHRTAFEKRLRRGYPAYYNLVHPEPIGLERLREVLGPDEAVLAYDVLPSRSLLFVATRERLSLFTIPGSSILRAGVARVRAHVDRMLAVRVRTKLEHDAAQDLPNMSVDSLALYRQIVPAAAERLIGTKHLIIVPSGPLYDIALEAMVTRRSATNVRYLIEDHAVSYTPSGSLLALVRAREMLNSRHVPLLAFASSAAEDVTVGSVKYHLDELDGVLEEAHLVRDALHAPPDSVVTGDDATRAQLLSLNSSRQLATYRYLLFATHAVLTHAVRGPDQPALVLAHSDRYGPVTMADVLGLTLDADFVALSACSTGQGSGSPGEGINGLTRAFMFAGTPAILVTLWEVDDRAAPQITPPFFAAMSTGTSPAAALRLAKLNMLHSSRAQFRHPYAWAPSVIFGDGGHAR